MASRITRAALAASPAAHAHPAPHPARPAVPTDDVPPMPTQASPTAAAPVPGAHANTFETVHAPVAPAEGSVGSDDAEPAAPVQYVGDKPHTAPLPAPIDLTIYPAGSDTEDPARGQPRLHVRPGKEITGGFADQAAMQYFALDGRELGVLVVDMLQHMANRVVNDLRFNEAITYPRVGVRVWVEVQGFAEDQSFTVDKIVPDAIALAGATTGDPTVRALTADIAREVADEVVFVLVAEKRETDTNGDPLDPPDKIRQELGLARPRKQMIAGPGNSRQIVDVIA